MNLLHKAFYMITARTRILSSFAPLLLSVAAVPVHADQITPHAGLRISRARVEISGIPNDTTLGGAIFLGFGTSTYRLTLDLVRHGYHDVETRGCIANYDRLWAVDDRMTLFVGVHGGVADFEPGTPDFRNKPYDSGLAGGGQAGVRFRLGRSLQLETGVRHTWFDVKTYSEVHERDLRLNHQTEAFLALMFSG